jgi:glucosamine-6-phosphate deaminase
MEIVIQPDYDRLCDEAAAIVFDALARKPDLVLGLATGRTPLGLYERLACRPEAFARAAFFNLDEFYGLPPTHPESFHAYLRRHLIDRVKHDPARVHLLRGDVADLDRAAQDYEDRIRAAGGIDLQILGIGRNGHIGFNEPGSSLGSRTRAKTLEPETVAEYAKSGQELPRFAITLGVGTIMEARRLLLLASGESKAEIIQRMVEGPVTAEVPASAIQFHPRAVVVLDEPAACRLKRRDYFKWVYANKYRVGQTTPTAVPTPPPPRG